MNIVTLARWIALHPLNRRTSLGSAKALGRFVRWQLASRLIPARTALPFVDSTCLLVERSMTGASGNWYCGLHEPSEMGFVLHALRPEDLFVDIGANIGSYTILSAGAVGAKAISIEPIPQTFSRLKSNVALNDLTESVKLLNLGISHQSGVLNFTRSFDTLNRVALPDEQLDCIEVSVRTLDDVMQGYTAHLIKIDVEGHERAVLRGAIETLKKPDLKAVIMETNSSGKKYGVDDSELIEEMRRYGFFPYTYDPLERKLAVTPEGASNSIFVRDPAAIAELCRSARSFTLLNGPI
mgnify:CR=1 FL=1